jgi:medium-chain acyl-[acyl-carrier-protein] hydrolase
VQDDTYQGGFFPELRDKKMIDMLKPNKWIHFPRPNPGAKMRLFCFHYAGGSAQAFHGWPERLPPSVEIGVIQLPGRGRRMAEPKATRLLPLSRAVALALQQFTDKPFAFFGHSLGALLCFEAARSLRREKQREPFHLFVSATQAPHRRGRDELLSTLPKAEFVKKLYEFEGTPLEVLQNDELLDLVLPTVRADFELCETYEYHSESPLDCPITIYGGLEDHEVEREGLAAWGEMTVGASTVRMFSGGHFYINTSRLIFLQTFARDLLQLLPQLQKAAQTESVK